MSLNELRARAKREAELLISYSEKPPADKFPPSVRSLLLETYQTAFMAGVLAGMETKENLNAKAKEN